MGILKNKYTVKAKTKVKPKIKTKATKLKVIKKSLKVAVKRTTEKKQLSFDQNVKIIGCGGIGSWLVDPLVKYLTFNPLKQKEKIVARSVSFIDGDFFEPKNMTRQQFNDFGPKAEVTRHRLQNSMMSNDEVVKFDTVCEYISAANIDNCIKEGDCVFLCVDNHKTRILISQHCQKLKNVTLISGGNELTDGNVLIYRKKDGVELTPPIEKYHAEIANPTDKNPADEVRVYQGCQAPKVLESAPQIVFMNFDVASKMLNAYYGLSCDGTLPYTEVFTDIKMNKSNALMRK